MRKGKKFPHRVLNLKLGRKHEDHFHLLFKKREAMQPSLFYKVYNWVRTTPCACVHSPLNFLIHFYQICAGHLSTKKKMRWGIREVPNPDRPLNKLPVPLELYIP
jgi:hypothetical protein